MKTKPKQKSVSEVHKANLEERTQLDCIIPKELLHINSIIDFTRKLNALVKI